MDDDGIMVKTNAVDGSTFTIHGWFVKLYITLTCCGLVRLMRKHNFEHFLTSQSPNVTILYAIFSRYTVLSIM